MNMQRNCDYCGEAKIASCDAKTSKGHILYSCSHCGLSFFDYPESGNQDAQTVDENNDSIPSEDETRELAINLLRTKSYAEACQAIDKCPPPWQNPVAMNFLRLAGEFGKPGVLTETNLKLLYNDKAEHIYTTVLDVIIDNLSHIDFVLPKNDPQRLYAAYCGMYEALSALADLQIQYYAETVDIVFGQPFHEDKIRKRYHRTDIWIKRAIACAILAQSMKAFHNDRLYGEKYREMSASLWSKCAEYNKKSPPVFLIPSHILVDTIADRITDYFVMNRQEKKIRQQLQSIIKDENASIELSYQPKNRAMISFFVYAIPITATISFVLAAFMLY